MTTLDVAASGSVSRPFFRPATVVTALLSAVLLLLAARYVIDAGYVRKDIQALEAGDAWRTGGWLSQVVLRVVSIVPDREFRQTALSLIAALAGGLSFGVVYERLRANGWAVAGALLVLVALLPHAGVLYTVTAQSRPLPLIIALAALIPPIRQLESVGDVQAAIGLGLLLPLLLLASPLTTPLIVPLAVGIALANPDGRRDPRAFVAMLLVALLPTRIVAIGILGFLAQAGCSVADALVPYVNAYHIILWRDPTPTLLALLVFAPVGLVPIAYCFLPGLPEARRPVSALLVVILPLGLARAKVMLNTTITTIVPPLALIAAFVSWLAVVRLPRSLRVFSIVMLILSAVLSWMLPALWTDPDWLGALLHVIPTGNLDLRPGV